MVLRLDEYMYACIVILAGIGFVIFLGGGLWRVVVSSAFGCIIGGETRLPSVSKLSKSLIFGIQDSQYETVLPLSCF